MLDFIKQMFAWGCDIRGYVEIGTITADQYKDITGEDYQIIKSPMKYTVRKGGYFYAERR